MKDDKIERKNRTGGEDRKKKRIYVEDVIKTVDVKLIEKDLTAGCIVVDKYHVIYLSVERKLLDCEIYQWS